MLQNTYFLAKIGADTAENEQHFAEILPKTGRPAARRPGLELEEPSAGMASNSRPSQVSALATSGPRWTDCAATAGPRGSLAKLAKLANFAKFLQIFGGLVLGCIKTKFCKKMWI